jgi:ubiquinone/menaquinone biosynthesis C-methylase UbiE
MRVFKHIPKSGKYILDMASGPVQYPEYLQFSKNFEKRYCVDFSETALEVAKKKLGDRGEYLCGNFFDLEIDSNFFDCSISLHTIYHIDKDKQAEAVRKLIKVTKPGKPIIIVYSNPNAFTSLITPWKLLRIIKSLIFKDTVPSIYFFAHPNKWWNQFSDQAEVKFYPWRSFSSLYQKILIPNNSIGNSLLKKLYALEEKYPNFFVNNFQYPMIVLTKKNNIKV